VKYTIDYLVDLFSEGDTKFSFVWRDDLDFNESSKQFEEILRPFLINEERVSEWPGTELEEVAATIRYYELCKGSANVLKKFDSPLEFFSPDFPEDLAVYKNGELVYGSCSHEKIEWIAN